MINKTFLALISQPGLVQSVVVFLWSASTLSWVVGGAYNSLNP